MHLQKASTVVAITFVQETAKQMVSDLFINNSCIVTSASFPTGVHGAWVSGIGIRDQGSDVALTLYFCAVGKDEHIVLPSIVVLLGDRVKVVFDSHEEGVGLALPLVCLQPCKS